MTIIIKISSKLTPSLNPTYFLNKIKVNKNNNNIKKKKVILIMKIYKT